MKKPAQHYILNISCPATSGIVAAVSTFLAQCGFYIGEMAQYDDEDSGRFFMRAVFRSNDGRNANLNTVRGDFEAIASEFDMVWSIHPKNEPMKVILMVSRYDHCLTDLLYRHQKGEINMQITAVVSNHLDLRQMAERVGIRFVYLPVNSENKRQQEQELLRIVEETGTELVVLARYMQVLSDELCQELSGRVINIHHSFLPGFKGAKPYHQAWERGVKLIGATAHYVTADLDEGPIIDQEVQRADHTYSSDALVAIGRDTETQVLSRAVSWHTERKVFMNGNRTVIFK